MRLPVDMAEAGTLGQMEGAVPGTRRASQAFQDKIADLLSTSVRFYSNDVQPCMTQTVQMLIARLLCTVTISLQKSDDSRLDALDRLFQESSKDEGHLIDADSVKSCVFALS